MESPPPSSGDRYTDLLREVVLDAVYSPVPPGVRDHLTDGHFFDASQRAISMVGRRRLNNVRALLQDVIRRGVPGDFFEAGSWRGGCGMFAAGVLAAASQLGPPPLRRVFVADSFEGLPKAADAAVDAEGAQIDLKYHHDSHKIDFGAFSVESVVGYFKRLDLWVDGATFVVSGWFNTSLPLVVSRGVVSSISLLRVDSDMYVSSRDVLENLYPLVEVGGYVVLDDMATWLGQRAAVLDFRKARGITSPMRVVWHGDENELAQGVYWQKSLLTG